MINITDKIKQDKKQTKPKKYGYDEYRVYVRTSSPPSLFPKLELEPPKCHQHVQL